jgi:hypothetical protein
MFVRNNKDNMRVGSDTEHVHQQVDGSVGVTTAAAATTTTKDAASASMQLLEQVMNDTGARHWRFVGRSNTTVTHIGASTDATTSQSLEGYMNTFVDLFIASQARCLTIGVGNFGMLAGLIGGTKCFTSATTGLSVKTYRKWGMLSDRNVSSRCPIPRNTSALE